MSTNVARLDRATGEITPLSGMTPEQVQLIKDTVARDQNLNDDELRLFLYTAQRLGLDPLAKQLYAVRRQGKITFQTGIDGYRLVAARTTEYVGSDDPQFVELVADQPPQRATVTVWRLVNGQRCPFTATAWWAEYYPGDGAVGTMWRKMPHTMLAKCAEALALRKAFPNELCGVYTDSEMEQAERPGGKPKPKPRPLNERSDAELAELAKWAVEKKDTALQKKVTAEINRRLAEPPKALERSEDDDILDQTLAGQ